MRVQSRVAFSLTGLPGSSEFMAAYEAALAGMTAPPPMIGASRTKPGTLNAAVVAYYQSLAFRELAPGTQAMRRSILERLRVKHGNETISRLPPRFIAQSLSRMGPGAARNWLKALRHLLEFAAAGFALTTRRRASNCRRTRRTAVTLSRSKRSRSSRCTIRSGPNRGSPSRCCWKRDNAAAM
jgi:hypothetical protein